MKLVVFRGPAPAGTTGAVGGSPWPPPSLPWGRVTPNKDTPAHPYGALSNRRRAHGANRVFLPRGEAEPRGQCVARGHTVPSSWAVPSREGQVGLGQCCSSSPPENGSHEATDGGHIGLRQTPLSVLPQPSEPSPPHLCLLLCSSLCPGWCLHGGPAPLHCPLCPSSMSVSVSVSLLFLRLLLTLASGHHPLGSLMASTRAQKPAARLWGMRAIWTGGPRRLWAWVPHSLGGVPGSGA